jgi:hypothetical protein
MSGTVNNSRAETAVYADASNTTKTVTVTKNMPENPRGVTDNRIVPEGSLPEPEEGQTIKLTGDPRRTIAVSNPNTFVKYCP